MDTFDVRSAPEHYDFRVNVKEECTPLFPGSPRCFVPAELVVLRKGTEQDVQRIDFDWIDLVLVEDGRLPVDAAGTYDWEGTFQIGDFNFDGREDFAVWNSQMGPYDSPTYRVFLYVKSRVTTRMRWASPQPRIRGPSPRGTRRRPGPPATQSPRPDPAPS